MGKGFKGEDQILCFANFIKAYLQGELMTNFQSCADELNISISNEPMKEL